MKTLQESLQIAARNAAWSNWILYKACLDLSQEDFEAPRTSFFPTLQKTLNHILLVDKFYFDAIQGGDIGPRMFEKFIVWPTAQELWAEQKSFDKNLVKFCDELRAGDMDRAVHIHRRSGICVEGLAATLSHMFVHQIHHRGQVHAMLSGTSVKPPQLDEFYLHPDVDDRIADLKLLDIEWPQANPLKIKTN